MQLQMGQQGEDGGDGYAGIGAPTDGHDHGAGVIHSNMHPAAAAAAAAGPTAMWGQQLPLQQQQQRQQLGYEYDGLVSFEQLQQLEPLPFGGAAPMDFTPGVSQGLAAALPGLGFE
jgi:hypothetical protein